MPIERIAPGVYVEESDAIAMPIEGVPTSTASLVGVYAREMAMAGRGRPEWGDFNASDPGVTLVQLFAFLAENLLYSRGGARTPDKLDFAVFVSRAALDPACVAATLVRLRAAAEHGVIEGLDVTTPEGEPDLVVGTGVAIGPGGESIAPDDDDPASTKRRLRRRNDP